ncbi:toll/interleukin-1 receptor domain-containing protein, partial [Methanobrevibacter sp.]|uniref:toll/interleukin-1 receptor domain-containing protein n=1 Tax=Methanobrevibacter sp. TaxID=66852 RepID=UPI00386542BD
MNHEVYISYSKKDSEIAMQICEAIESNDIRCWISSRDLDRKKDPIEQMANAIQSAENVVLIYSKNAMESQNVKNEISFALSNQISVIPVNVDASSEVPDLFIGANKPKATFQGISDNF